jgi:hypothetical protein
MKLFGRTGGYYLFWSGFLYIVASIICINMFPGLPQVFVQLGWVTALMLPLTVPQIGRYFNMPTLGDVMWRKREIGDKVANDIEDANVLQFPEVKKIPPMPTVAPPTNELDVAQPPYTIGKNDSGNIQFRMRTDYGSTWLTMNDEGVISLIEDLSHQIRSTHTVTITEK